MTEIDAFAFLKGDNQGDFITYSAFVEALRLVRFIRRHITERKMNCLCGNIRFTCFLLFQVNLIGVPCGLSFQETRDLWIQADIDGNGVVDYEEFKVTSTPKLFGVSLYSQLS